jgi:hypothetical protein
MSIYDIDKQVLDDVKDRKDNNRRLLETDPREASVQLIIVQKEIYPALITGIGNRLRLIENRV